MKDTGSGTTVPQTTEQKLRVIAEKITYCLTTIGLLIASKKTPRAFGDYIDHIQNKDAELSQLREDVNIIIRKHKILCPACEGVSALGSWGIVRGHRRDEALVINCPLCRATKIMGDFPDGEEIKDFVSRTYVLPKHLFKSE